MPAAAISPTAFFVYGTLRQGGALAHLWPTAPLSVEPATTVGELYDLGRYPALLPGEDTVAGELWTFAPDAMPAVLERIDRVEGYANSANDLYRRAVVLAQVAASDCHSAFAYFFARPLSAHARRIMPDADGCCRW